jgi:hypothetical protein
MLVGLVVCSGTVADLVGNELARIASVTHRLTAGIKIAVDHA